MSDPLYHTDPTGRAFTATVTALSEDRRTIVLDRTLFYPAGGGQPADAGTINGIAVTDVRKDEDGRIHHSLAATPHGRDEPPLAEGDAVSGIVDWDHRFEYMQQHTGQHVLSGSLYEVAGVGTVSVAQGSEYTSIEIDTDALSRDTIDRVVDRANEVIREDLDVSGFWVDESEIASYTLRRPAKRKGRIRLVQIGTEPFDLVACGGVHLPRTGLLNLIEVIAIERIRGHQRLHSKIGNRALGHYRSSHRLLATVAGLYSSHPSDVPERVRREIESGQELRRTVRLQSERIAGYIVDAAEKKAPSPRAGAAPRTNLVEIRLSNEDAVLFNAVVEAAADRTGGESDRYVVVHTVGGAIHWAIVIGGEFPTDRIRANVLAPFGAKGGGKRPLWRGIIPGTDDVEITTARFIATLRNTLEASE